MSKKIFISQAMRDLNETQIVEIRNLIINGFTNLFGKDFEIIESYKPELKSKSPVEALGKSLGMLSEADILLAPRYNRDQMVSNSCLHNVLDITLKGVEFEILIAENYNIPTIFYDFNEKKTQVYFQCNVLSTLK